MTDATSPADTSDDSPAGDSPAGDTPAGEPTFVTTTTRDMDATRGQFAAWLNSVLPTGADADVHELKAPTANGMSSESLLVEASWNDGGERTTASLVVRVAPPLTAVPVFPSYDFDMQFGLLSLVASHSTVPVPNVRWLETDPSALGSPFFVMDRVDGRVPPDNMPYNMGSWVTEASAAERNELQRSTVAAIAGIHGIDPATAVGVLGPMPTEPLRDHVAGQRTYYEWMRINDLDDEIVVPLIERSLTWLEEHWPADEGPGVISWGDSRIGNILYDGFTPAAVLDWEMAAFAPREVDLAWSIFLHRFFEDIATTFELDGLPDFFRRADIEATYAEMTGHVPQNMDWHLIYAAVRHANVMSRVKIRAIHFGEAEMPDDLDDLIMHRAALESMLDGTYWPK